MWGGGARSHARRPIGRSGGSRGPGRTYFFLVELDLLVDLLELLFVEGLPLFFAPPELVLDLAMITLLCGRHNRREEITVPIRLLRGD